MLRTSLQKSDHGFKEVYVHCSLCGRIELVGSMRCGVCWTVLRALRGLWAVRSDIPAVQRDPRIRLRLRG